MTLTDYYAEQSCTAGRASFIMGQSVFRTGLSKVGLPGAKEGMRAEDPTIAGMLKAQGYATGQGGVKAIGREYKVHLDGYDILPLLTGETDKGPRMEIFYFSDDGDLTALRYGDWKILFMEPKVPGTLRVWQEPFVPLRLPFIFRLRRDPYERATITSNAYYDWMLDRAYVFVPVPGDIQGVPAAPEGSELQPGSCHGETGASGGLVDPAPLRSSNPSAPAGGLLHPI